MIVDVLATERHFGDHIAPVYEALPDHLRGTWHELDAHTGTGPILVASYGDTKRARAAGRSPIIALEHGAGQSYSSTVGNYAGGQGREGTALFLVPNDYAGDKWRQAYPHASVMTVGCPKLDRHTRRRPTEQPTVVLSFHWNAQVGVPEATSAFAHYVKSLDQVRARFDNVIGHGHPRMMQTLRPIYQRLGIPVVDDFRQVLEVGSVYVCDNSSTLFEAATEMPVVVLNAPWYRRHVRHGGRFWDWATVGQQVDEPSQLVAAIETQLDESTVRRLMRHDVVRQVYGELDGRAASRAADAIVDLVERAVAA